MHPKANVLLLNHTATLGGAELALLRLAKHLDRDRFQLRALLFSDGPLTAELSALDLPVDVLPLSPEMLATSRHEAKNKFLRTRTALQLWSYVRRLARYIRQHKIDLIHANSLKANVIGGLACLLARRPYVWHMRDRLAGDYMPAATAKLLRGLARLLPAFVIANSKSTLETVRLRRDARCRVIYSGVDALPASREPRRPAEKATGPTVGIVGRISPTKGHDIFLRAAAEVLPRFPDARFQIIGSAMFGEKEYEEELRQMAQTLGIADSVKFVGFVKDVPQRMAQLDLLVLASTVPEPFGQVVVEAMTMGTPVVATDAGGPAEVIEHGSTGLLVEPGDIAQMADAICQMLADPEGARRMAERAKAQAAERFTINHTARAVESVYDAVLAPTLFTRQWTTVFRPATRPAAPAMAARQAEAA